MNVHAPRPDRSPEAVAARQKAIDQARASNIRQGYQPGSDPILEEASAAYVAGVLTREEYHARILPQPKG
ncbi:hypothetical protein JZX86_27030 [Agrobacterium rosae]|uniref:antitoxin VbhA family protein n=1 Tax=Agrobacterium rosae TaxID=1972867 RepID=UPI0019D34F46|nr:antitoxin VbhA family protein [Agrobacterium rosae]MBN7808982.1 hypothetical protein [Agrobacterium rosae]